MAKLKRIRAWHIGEPGEIFAGRCDERGIKRWFAKLIGDSADAKEQIGSFFEEIDQEELGTIRPWNIDGKTVRTTYLKEAERCVELPMQIATTYN